MWRDLRDRGALVDRRPEPLHGGGEAACELGWLNAGAVRREGRTEHVLDPDAHSRLLVVEERNVAIVESEGVFCRYACANACKGDRGLRERERPALDEVALDALLLDYARHLVDRPLNRADEPERATVAAPLGPASSRSDELADEPTTISTRGAETCELGLEDRYSQ